jgi:hypothetical protein
MLALAGCAGAQPHQRKTTNVSTNNNLLPSTHVSHDIVVKTVNGSTITTGRANAPARHHTEGSDSYPHQAPHGKPGKEIVEVTRNGTITRRWVGVDSSAASASARVLASDDATGE